MSPDLQTWRLNPWWGVVGREHASFLTEFDTCHYQQGGDYELFHRSETTRHGMHVRFPEFTASYHRCCLGEPETYLRLEVWNEEKYGQHTLLGGSPGAGVILLEAA